MFLFPRNSTLLIVRYGLCNVFPIIFTFCVVVVVVDFIFFSRSMFEFAGMNIGKSFIIIIDGLLVFDLKQPDVKLMVMRIAVRSE
jgi:hypothetical protein